LGLLRRPTDLRRLASCRGRTVLALKPKETQQVRGLTAREESAAPRPRLPRAAAAAAPGAVGLAYGRTRLMSAVHAGGMS
jgi:hypothetical protein